MNIEKINVGGNLYDVCDTNARAMISDEYNSATQYSAGDYCIWENTLKKANKSTTGTFDSTAWDDTNLVEAVGELNQKIPLQVKSKTITFSDVPANGNGQGNQIVSEDGLYPLGVVGWANASSSSFYPYRLNIIGSTLYAYIKNISGESIPEASISVNVLYQRT